MKKNKDTGIRMMNKTYGIILPNVFCIVSFFIKV